MVFCDGQSYVKYSGLASKAHLFVFLFFTGSCRQRKTAFVVRAKAVVRG